MRVFLREIIKARVGSETAYGAYDPHMTVRQYLWHTIQSHRGMTEFREASLCQQTSMFPSVDNHLFEHRAGKVDVDVLTAKTWEQDNIHAKQTKYIKQMNFALYLFYDKFKRGVGGGVWYGRDQHNLKIVKR